MSSPRSSYDVVVVGASLALVGAGALLARRGFRVLVLGHGVRPEVYPWEGLALRRVPLGVAFLECPAFRRMVAELALVPSVRRRVQALDPPFQVVLPGHRLEAAAVPERLLAELNREFPEIQRPVEDFYRRVEAVRAQLDRTLGADVLLPPEGFWERRELARAATGLPFDRHGAGRDPFAEFASDHPFRTYVEAQTRFAGALDPDAMLPLARARLHAAGFGHAWLAEGGVDGLRELFAEKIVQHGGDLRLRDRAEAIAVHRGRVRSVSLAGLDESVGCGFALCGLDPAEVQRLTGQEPSRHWIRRLLGLRARYHRYVLNVVVRAEAVPVGMAGRVYAVLDLRRPLAEENLLSIDRGPADEAGRVVLTVSALLPRSLVEEGTEHLRRVRPRVLRALGEIVPFLDRHMLAVDSPHDGLALEDRRGVVPVPVELRRAGAAEPMETLDAFEETPWLGVCGLPLRTDIEGLLLASRHNVPGLGAEGEMLAALGAARLVTRSDPSRERMRRELWSKDAP